MKKTIMTMLAVVLCLASCMEEKGNYDYQSKSDWYPAPLTAVGIGNVNDKDHVHMVTLGDKLTIEPAFESADVRESDYEFLWYLNREGVRDSIGRSLKLVDYEVAMHTGDQPLWLKITKKANGISRTYSATMRIVTDFGSGWFVTKEVDGGMTDVDIVKYDNSRHAIDVIAMVNGTSAPGLPVRSSLDALHAVSGGYEYVDDKGETHLESMLWVLTDKQVRPYMADYMTPGLDMDNLFQALPNVMKPQDFVCFNHLYSKFDLLINDGQLHYGVGRNTQLADGMFGQLTEAIFTDLRINPSVCKLMVPTPIMGIDMNGSAVMLAFDENSHKFHMFHTGFFAPTPSNNISVKPLQALPVDLNLEWMMESNGSAGLGLLKKNDGTYWAFNTRRLAWETAQISANLTPDKLFESEPILSPAGRVMNTAKVRAAHSTLQTVFCSAGDNEVYAFRTGTAEEKKIITLPAGEEVSFIHQIANTDNVATFDHLVVLSNTAGGWKLRCYDFTSGTATLASDTPVKEYSGEGRAVHALYRSLEKGQHSF